MQTLYRKFRPQGFTEVFGQEAIVRVLRSQVRDKKVGHAYLFPGPRGTGKTSMARLLAKAVNCISPQKGNPCKKCTACIAIEQGRFLDLIEIDAASNRGIDEIRKLRERVNFAPTEGKYKVYIIDEVHMLTKDAFNALLKTLEEPPKHVIFILATTEPHKIPSTILSRCQRFSFTLANDETIMKKLKYICKVEKVKFTEEALLAIVKNASGSFRDSESILEKVLGAMGVVKDRRIDIDDVKDILGLAEEKQVDSFIKYLINKQMKRSLKVFHKALDSGVNIFQFVRQSLEHSRELLIEKISKRRSDFILADLLTVITELSDAENKLRYTQVKRLPVEVAIVKVCNQSSEIVSALDMPKAKQGKKKKIKKIVTKAISDFPVKIKSSKKGKSENTKINLKQINDKWLVLIDRIRPFNHHLSAFFKRAKPIDVRNGCITLNVPFKFHKQRIENMKAQEIFRSVSKQVFNTNLTCTCKVVVEKDKGESQVESVNNSNVVLEVLGDILE